MDQGAMVAFKNQAMIQPIKSPQHSKNSEEKAKNDKAR
jgi:hypothetical protein